MDKYCSQFHYTIYLTVSAYRTVALGTKTAAISTNRSAGPRRPPTAGPGRDGAPVGGPAVAVFERRPAHGDAQTGESPQQLITMSIGGVSQVRREFALCYTACLGQHGTISGQELLSFIRIPSHSSMFSF